MGGFLNLEGRIAVVTGGARGIGPASTHPPVAHGLRAPPVRRGSLAAA